MSITDANPGYDIGAANSAMAQYVTPPIQGENSGASNHVTATRSFAGSDAQPTEAGTFYGEHASPDHDKQACGYCHPRV